MDISDDLVVLNSFFNAMDAGRACQFLEEVAIPFKVKDLSLPQQGVNRFLEVPAIHLDVMVREADLERAKSCLRTTMHLFPEREAYAAEYDADEDGSVVQVAACEELTDVEAVRTVLIDAAIWCTVRSIADEEDAATIIYCVEVKWQDCEKAMNALELQWKKK